METLCARRRTVGDTGAHGRAWRCHLYVDSGSERAGLTYRDDYMLRLHNEYPQYGWDTNKGYPTAEHYAALKQFGPTPYHRISFNLKLND